ncbi:hypothetical protein BHU72_08865 [Desulfuribacillus stibiiarsenatis]|uniref:UPF0473 protein BHU72_08865 n=1 Tax=Desulfuribacillus stibiiarsenatis TaxID=1390249 RepID=A0A1E5L382_9FIRM|nr:DUF1292 domain-containing protein [Desulfuribacillus stibiiarsenatis]OEH84598.1 hypothetical protein BHU72_08865 [Desulfuribacillus stibiiarsenatis]
MSNCEHDYEHDHECEESTVVLTDEDGNEHEFELLTILEVDNTNYAVLLPLEIPEGEDGEDFEEEAIILRINQDEEGNDVLQEIEDDAEWDKVAAEYDKLAEEDEE